MERMEVIDLLYKYVSLSNKCAALIDKLEREEPFNGANYDHIIEQLEMKKLYEEFIQDLKGLL